MRPRPQLRSVRHGLLAAVSSSGPPILAPPPLPSGQNIPGVPPPQPAPPFAQTANTRPQLPGLGYRGLRRGQAVRGFRPAGRPNSLPRTRPVPRPIEPFPGAAASGGTASPTRPAPPVTPPLRAGPSARPNPSRPLRVLPLIRTARRAPLPSFTHLAAPPAPTRFRGHRTRHRPHARAADHSRSLRNRTGTAVHRPRTGPASRPPRREAPARHATQCPRPTRNRYTERCG